MFLCNGGAVAAVTRAAQNERTHAEAQNEERYRKHRDDVLKELGQTLLPAISDTDREAAKNEIEKSPALLLHDPLSLEIVITIRDIGLIRENQYQIDRQEYENRNWFYKLLSDKPVLRTETLRRELYAALPDRNSLDIATRLEMLSDAKLIHYKGTGSYKEYLKADVPGINDPELNNGFLGFSLTDKGNTLINTS